MYIQLTERCNMRCPHCCMNATTKGRDMDYSAFVRAFTWASSYGSYMTLGGGEPTLCRDFSEILRYVHEMLLCGSTLEEVLMITNGTRVRNTMAAVRVMEELEEIGGSLFHVVLSADDGFHDDRKIHPKVYEYFHCHQRSSNQHREFIRSVQKVYRVGRAKSFDRSDFVTEGCSCPTVTVRPNGDIHACGCLDSPKIGNVFYRDDPHIEDCTCYREWEQKPWSDLYEKEMEECLTA